jgi:hypothetical protein
MTGPCLENSRGVCAESSNFEDPEAKFGPLAWIDSTNNPESNDPSMPTCVHEIFPYLTQYTTLPSHASNVIQPKPSNYVARHGVEHLMTCCSHRRSSRVLLSYLGM